MSSNLLETVSIATAPEASRPVLENIQKGFGFVPNLMATFANSPAVLKGYLALDEEWSHTGFTPVEREIVLLSASLENDCGYCVAAHSTISQGFLKVPAATIAAIRAGRSTGDAEIDTLVALTRELVGRRGHAQPETIRNFLQAGHTRVQVMELLIGVALKTISNYLDHLNPSALDAAFQAAA